MAALKLPKILSRGEETLAFHLTVNGIDFEREATPVPGRKWRVDFLIRPFHLVVEIEGGVWTMGATREAQASRRTPRSTTR